MVLVVFVLIGRFEVLSRSYLKSPRNVDDGAKLDQLIFGLKRADHRG